MKIIFLIGPNGNLILNKKNKEHFEYIENVFSLQ